MNEYLLLLKRNSNYRYLWLGGVISQLGDWFNLLASAELITDLTGSGVAISSLFLARFLPLFLFSPIAGVLADRFNRRNMLILSDVFRGITVLGFLFIRNPSQVWLLYGLTVVQFCLSAVFIPARAAVLANLVPRKDLVTANALDGLTWSTMLALGALLGGIVAALFGRETAFILDAATYWVSAAVIGLISVTRLRPAAAAGQTGWLDFIEGFRYLRAQPFILMIGLVKAAGSLLWGSVDVFQVTFADHVFPLNTSALAGWLRIEDGGTATLGIIYFFIGLGTGFGPLIFRKALGDAINRLLVGISIGFWLAAWGIFSLGVANSLPLFLTATLVRTVGTGVLWVFSAVTLQMLVPDAFRGRVFAFEFAVLTLTQSLSTLAAGLMQDTIGLSVHQAARVMGGLGFVVALLWLVAYWRGLRLLNTGRVQPIALAESGIDPVDAV